MTIRRILSLRNDDNRSVWGISRDSLILCYEHLRIRLSHSVRSVHTLVRRTMLACHQVSSFSEDLVKGTSTSTEYARFLDHSIMAHLMF